MPFNPWQPFSTFAHLGIPVSISELCDFLTKREGNEQDIVPEDQLSYATALEADKQRSRFLDQHEDNNGGRHQTYVRKERR